MFTTAYRDSVLDTMDGVALSAWTAYASFLKSITAWRAGTVVEADYTGYGVRPSVSWGAAADTSPTGGRQKANDVAITFPTNTGATQDVIAIGYHTASGGGTLRGISLIDADPPVLGVGNPDDTIDAYAHGLQTDQRVFVMAAPGAVTPTGLSEDVAYFVLASGLTADVFKLSTSSGGPAVNITAGGAAWFLPYKALTIPPNATPEIAIGAAIWQL